MEDIIFKINPDEGYEVESVIINTDGIDSDPIPSENIIF